MKVDPALTSKAGAGRSLGSSLLVLGVTAIGQFAEVRPLKSRLSSAVARRKTPQQTLGTHKSVFVPYVQHNPPKWKLSTSPKTTSAKPLRQCCFNELPLQPSYLAPCPCLLGCIEDHRCIQPVPTKSLTRHPARLSAPRAHLVDFMWDGMFWCGKGFVAVVAAHAHSHALLGP